MLDRIAEGKYLSPKLSISDKTAGANATFGELLRKRMENIGTQPISSQNTGEIEFSKHARQRVEERGIEINSALLAQLSNSVQKAQEKGAKNILAFDNLSAFIIDVPQNRVVTAISKDEMQNNVFTNIDGAVLLK